MTVTLPSQTKNMSTTYKPDKRLRRETERFLGIDFFLQIAAIFHAYTFRPYPTLPHTSFSTFPLDFVYHCAALVDLEKEEE